MNTRSTLLTLIALTLLFASIGAVAAAKRAADESVCIKEVIIVGDTVALGWLPHPLCHREGFDPRIPAHHEALSHAAFLMPCGHALITAWPDVPKPVVDTTIFDCPTEHRTNGENAARAGEGR